SAIPTIRFDIGHDEKSVVEDGDDDMTIPQVDDDRDLSEPQQPSRMCPLWFQPFSYLTLSWLTPMMRKGIDGSVEFEDLPELRQSMLASQIAQQMEDYNRRISDALERGVTARHLPSPLGHIFGLVAGSWILAVFLALVATCIDLFLPILLRGIILYMVDHSSADSFFIASPLALVFTLFGLTVGKTVLETISAQEMVVVTFKVKTALINVLSDKSLRASYKTSLEFSEGRILQMITFDSLMIGRFAANGFRFFITIFQIVVSVFVLTNILKCNLKVVAGIFGVAIFLIFGTVPFLKWIQRNVWQSGDDRVRLIREVFSGIKILKIRALDVHFEKAIKQVRDFQLRYLGWFIPTCMFTATVAVIVPPAVTIGILVFYAKHTDIIDAAVIYPALSYTRILVIPLQVIPYQLMAIVQAFISWGRIRSFLQAEEVEDVRFGRGIRRDDRPIEKNVDVEIRSGTFKWDVRSSDARQGAVEAAIRKAAKKNRRKDTEPNKEESQLGRHISPPETWQTGPFFENLDFKLRKGSLTAVVGSVGSGKSSLIAAITSQMSRISGSVQVQGRIAVCYQEPWLVSRSIKDNILFGLPFVPSKLEATIRSVALDVDLNDLFHGVDTMIGERGIALSGGQRARVALARAVYANADIYLLDDPLAALDAHVGKQVYDSCIAGILRNKTRLLVTHQLQYLPLTDHVIVMEDGRIVEEGSYAQLMAKGKILAEMMRSYNFAIDESEHGSVQEGSVISSVAAPKQPSEVSASVVSNLLQEEDRERGYIQFAILRQYFKQSGGFVVAGLLTFVVAIHTLMDIASGLFLTWWVADKFTKSNRWYFNLFSEITGIGAGFTVLMAIIIAYQGLTAARNFHQKAVAGLFRAPMSFFDSQPLGRVLNRLSKDVQEVDMQIWLQLMQCCYQISKTLASIVVVALLTPSSLLIAVPLIIIFYFVTLLYRASNRELKRLAAVNGSPLIAHVSEVLSGVITIRSFRAQSRSSRAQRHYTDESNVPAFLQELLPVWLSFRIGVCCPSWRFLRFSSLASACLVSISITMRRASDFRLRQFSLFQKRFARLFCICQLLSIKMVSIERLDHYIRKLPREPQPHRRDDPPAGKWPSKGRIQFDNVEARYESRDVAVLKNLTVEVIPGEKLGIVGRTGSGKSTMLSMLFRLMEPTRGSVKIDNLDISKLGLRTLRSRIEMIPQEPVLFSGTIRSNIDIDDKCTDDQIWEALELVGMKSTVAGLENKLDSRVSDRGENFSVGEKQLFTLARAICANPKILVLDEASSAIDPVADAHLQRSIRTHFKHSTVVCIAHRLVTVADYDRILVLEGGKLAELGTPKELLALPHGYFRRLADATGTANAKVLEEMAERRFQETQRAGARAVSTIDVSKAKTFFLCLRNCFLSNLKWSKLVSNSNNDVLSAGVRRRPQQGRHCPQLRFCSRCSSAADRRRRAGPV
ncbi:P-loop containing nucleoside triphosphate hydrolase protein, partial [Zopfochytrium polystomum]